MFHQGKERQRYVSATDIPTNFGYSRQVWGLCYPLLPTSCWNGLGWTEVGHLELPCEFRQNHCRFYLQGVTELYIVHLAPWKIQGGSSPTSDTNGHCLVGCWHGAMGWSWEQRRGKRAQQSLRDRWNGPGPKGIFARSGEIVVTWTPKENPGTFENPGEAVDTRTALINSVKHWAPSRRTES